MKNTAEYLKEKGVRPSAQSVAIMKYLMEHKVHPTVDDIYNAILPDMPSLSKTTVYNVLKHLEEKGALKSLLIDEKNIRYDADTSSHMHFKCNKCGKLYDLKQPDFSMLTGTEDFEIKQVHLYCWGLCPDCKSENTSVNEDFNNYKQ